MKAAAQTIRTGTMDGLVSGLIGVIIFSGSLPATRLAVLGLPPLFVTSARAAMAAVLAAVLLLILRQKRPQRSDLLSLAVIALGVVIGFPLLTALALRSISSAHSIVFIGLLPLATAAFGVLRGGERPKPLFWLFSVLGSLLVVGFALSNGGQASLQGDLLMIAAVIVCGLGYAEGGKLARSLGGWQVICWALVLSMPPMALLCLFTWPQDLAAIPVTAWAGLSYVTVFSMLVGFIFWYHGLAKGGTASVGQLQLLQPFFGLLLAALLLGEAVSWSMLAATTGVILCVAAARYFARPQKLPKR